MIHEELTNEELAKEVAKVYDQRGYYHNEYAVLVRRVGQAEAERLVDQIGYQA